MLKSKFTKCAILSGMLLMLFISPSFASGVPLIPDDNVTVRCTTFIEKVKIGYAPGEVSIYFRGNLISENSIEQLTLVIPSSSENFDNDSIEIIFLTGYDRQVKIEHFEIKLHHEGYYLHKFRLLINPPFTEDEIIINYDTILKEWVDIDVMHLPMLIWSPKIILENYGRVEISGPSGYGFGLLNVTTTIENTVFKYSDYRRTLSFTIEPSQLVDFQYMYLWSSIYYTPASLPLKDLWDQYQNIAEILQRTNQLLQKTEESLSSAKDSINTTVIVGIFGIIMTSLVSIIVTSYFVRRRTRRPYRWQKKIRRK